jgi:hypothetical protein
MLQVHPYTSFYYSSSILFVLLHILVDFFRRHSGSTRSLHGSLKVYEISSHCLHDALTFDFIFLPHSKMKANTKAVRRYYTNNRSDIIRRKTLTACRTVGRVPRATTIHAHAMPLDELMRAFDAWLTTREREDALRTRRSQRMDDLVAKFNRP